MAPSVTTMNGHFMDIGGQRFFLRTWGDADAPPVLMLHGFPEYSGAWEEVATRLADRFFCIAPDQRGFGQSWAPPEVAEYALPALLSDMAAVIDAHGGRAHVVGHDWGAAVAYGLAMFMPERVGRLVVMNGVHPVPFQRALAAGGAQTEASQYIRWLREEGSDVKLAEDDFALMLRLFSAKMDLSWLAGDRLAAYKAEWARPGRMRGMTNWYRASPLVVAEPGKPVEAPPLPVDRLRVKVPHLLIWGENDTALLPEATEGLEDFCDAGLERVTVAGADHWLAHQKPDEVAGLVGAWLDR